MKWIRKLMKPPKWKSRNLRPPTLLPVVPVVLVLVAPKYNQAGFGIVRNKSKGCAERCAPLSVYREKIPRKQKAEGCGMFTVDIAGHPFAIENKYSYVTELCKAYLRDSDGTEEILCVSDAINMIQYKRIYMSAD